MGNKTNYAKINNNQRKENEIRRDTMEHKDVAEKPTPEVEVFEVFTAVVTGCSNLNMRTEPKLTASIINTLPAGTEVNVIGESDGWYEYKFNGRSGYSMTDYLERGE